VTASPSDPRDAKDLANLRALGIDPDKLDIGPDGTDLLPKRDDRELVTARGFIDYALATAKSDAGAATVHPQVIVSLGRPTAATALAHATKAQLAPFWRELGHEVAHGTAGQTPVTVAQMPIGSAAAVMLLEELIACGGQQFIVLGTAGSLRQSLSIGAIVLPTEAIREEGTSFHYVPAGSTVAPDTDLVERLASSCGDLSVPFRRGPVWTTDAPFRELASKVTTYAAMGVLAVDMEAAALFAVAALRGVRLAMLLAIADMVADPWRPGYLSSELRATQARLAEIATKCVSAGTKVG
jgi:uridine phosphorylase